MSNPIVTVNVSQQVAPAPSTLQKTGALISQGATNTAAGTKSLLTQLSDLTPLLSGTHALSALSWSGGVVTATATTPHGLTVSDTIPLTIAGATPSGYNGSFVATITSTTQFTYPLAANPGSSTVFGTYTEEDVAELLAMATTFFAQGGSQSVFVLELGPGNAADGVTFLTAWIAANPGVFYSYLVPRYWDGNSSFLTFVATFEALGSKTYFYVTTTLQNFALYTALMKSVVALVEAPNIGAWAANVLTAISWSGGIVTATTTTNHGVAKGQYFKISGVTPVGYNGTFLALDGTTGSTLVYALASNPGMETVLGTLVQSLYASAPPPSTEFSMAALFFVTLNQRPSSTNKVTPLNFAFVFGVTTFSIPGNAALIQTLLDANISIIGTGAQGGISAAVVFGGNMKDGNPFKFWYSVDWVQINLALNVTAALINGANNPQAPVEYNQPGINVLQQVAVTTMNQGVSNALVLNPVKPTTLSAADFTTAVESDQLETFTAVNADPFASYTAENPNDYKAGVYNGISVDYTPLRDFESITINVNVSSFA